MRTTHWSMTAILGLILTGCAGIATAPTPEARQALAPTGKLRIGLVLGRPVSVIRESPSGEVKERLLLPSHQIGFDLGKEFARRMGVPFEPVVYESSGALIDSAKSGAWDVTVLTVSPARAKEVDFTGPLVEVDYGFLIPRDSSISTLADVDRPGIRVGVQERGAADSTVSRALKNAQVVRGPGVTAGLQMVKSGKADVIAANKTSLFEMSDQLPGSRVLDGGFATEQVAMAIPKGREFGLAYLRKFVEEAKSEGLVKAAIERAGLRGVVAAPLK